MEFFNVIDERGRFCGCKAHDTGRNGQYNTHTYSYEYARAALNNDSGELERILINGGCERDTTKRGDKLSLYAGGTKD